MSTDTDKTNTAEKEKVVKTATTAKEEKVVVKTATATKEEKVVVKAKKEETRATEVETEKKKAKSTPSEEKADSTSKEDEGKSTEDSTVAAPSYNKERTYQNRGPKSGGGYRPNYQGQGGRGGKRYPRRRVCSFCVNKVEEIDYIKLSLEIIKSFEYGRDRDGERRPRYITEKGRIIPRRISGICVKHQRALATAVKRGRIMALLPFQND